MAVTNLSDLRNRAEIIRQETQVGANTALRIGQFLRDTVDTVFGILSSDNINYDTLQEIVDFITTIDTSGELLAVIDQAVGNSVWRTSELSADDRTKLDNSPLDTQAALEALENLDTDKLWIGNNQGKKTEISLVDLKTKLDAAVTVTTLPAPSLQLSASSSTTINATVGTVDNASSYELDYKAVSSSTWQRIATVSGTTQVTNLLPSTSYDFRVRAIGDGGVNYNNSSYTEDSTSTLSAPVGDLQFLQIQSHNVINFHDNYKSGQPKENLIDEYEYFFYDADTNTFSNSQTPITNFHNGDGLGSWYFPWPMIFDFQKQYNIRNISFFRYTKSNVIDIYCGDNGVDDWTLVKTIDLGTDFATVVEEQVDINCRFIKVAFQSGGDNIPTLIAFAGTPLSGDAEFNIPPLQPLTAPQPSVDKFMGVNSFNDVPASIDRVSKVLREYLDNTWFTTHNPSGVTYPNLTYRFAPVNAGFNFDNFYETRLNAGQLVIPVMKNCPRHLDVYLDSTSNHRGEFKPLGNGYTNDQADDPFAYQAYAELLFQFAARYGSTAVDVGLLKVDSADTVRTGLGYIQWMEIWNEPDTWWRGELGYFDPEMLAAMISAAVDGHKGALGPGHGIRTADPNMKICMGGTAKKRPDYWLSMLRWWDVHRGPGDYPIDAIAFHHYSNNAGGQGSSTAGYSPEQDDLMNKMIEQREWLQRYTPDLEMYNGEVGWDTQVSGGQTAEAIDDNGIVTDTYHVQAQWLLRAIFAHMAAGIHRIDMYMIRDAFTNANETYGKYGNSGLTTSSSNGYGRKPSWFFWNTLRSKLKDYYFDSVVQDGGSVGIWIMKFTKDTDNIAYAVWYGTVANNSSEETINIDSSMISCNLVQFVDRYELGVSSNLPITSNQVTTTISETPVLLMCSTSAVTVPTAPILTLEDVGVDFVELGITDYVLNEEEFILERSTTSGSGFTEVDSILGGVLTYLDDDGITDDQVYYYRIKSRNSAGDSPYSSELVVKTPKDGLSLNRSIPINFRVEGNGSEADDLNYVEYLIPEANVGTGESYSEADLVRLNGSPTGIGLELSDWGYGANNGGGTGGNAIHSDLICASNIYTPEDGVATLRFFNLNPARYYTIRFFSRRGWVSQSVVNESIFTSGLVQDVLNYSGNLTGEGIIYTVQPNGSGEITVTVEPGPDNSIPNGVINALILEEYLSTVETTVDLEVAIVNPRRLVIAPSVSTPIPISLVDPTSVENTSTAFNVNPTIEYYSNNEVAVKGSAPFDGTLYYGIYAPVATPTASEIKAGTGAAFHGDIAVSNGTEFDLLAEHSLSSTTQYKIHLFAENAGATQQTEIRDIEFTTFSATPSPRVYDPAGLSFNSSVYGQSVNYLLYIPEGYDNNTKDYPIHVFMIGAGENNSNNVNDLKTHGPFKVITDNGDVIPSGVDMEDMFFLAVCEVTDNSNNTKLTVYKEIIDIVLANYRVDQQRISLSGVSMGANGAADFAIDYPEFTAAVAPLSGAMQRSQYLDADNLRLFAEEVALWLFHGTNDNPGFGITPTNATAFYNDVLAATPLVTAPKYSLVDGATHGGSFWNGVYSNSGTGWTLSSPGLDALNGGGRTSAYSFFKSHIKVIPPVASWNQIDTGVPVDATLIATFRDRIYAADGTILDSSNISSYARLRLTDDAGATVPCTITINAAGTEISFDPDSDLDYNTQYYAEIDGIKTKRSSAYTDQAHTFTTAATAFSQTVKVNTCRAAANLADWNDINTTAPQDQVGVVVPLNNTDGDPANINFVQVESFFSSAHNVEDPGDGSGVYPDAVYNSIWDVRASHGVSSFKFTNLDQTYLFDLGIGSWSNAGAGVRVVDITVTDNSGPQTVQRDSQGNLTETVFSDLVPDSNGEILVELAEVGSSFQFMFPGCTLFQHK